MVRCVLCLSPAFCAPDCLYHASVIGITIGEIGPKLGQNTLNNGYLMFDHVKVPRDHMLMRNARVHEVSVII